MQKALTARADTAENICGLGSLVSFRRSFWHYSRDTDLLGRSNWTARQEDRLLNPTVLDFRAVVVTGSPNLVWPSFLELFMEE